MQNDPETPIMAANILSALQEQMANMQKFFIKALKQQEV